MRAVVQRVNNARVKTGGKLAGAIKKGLCVFLGINHDDTEKEAVWLADKLSVLRIFEDEDGRMNLSIQDIKGAVLVVSQFTLYGNCNKGRRPSFVDAAEPGKPEYLYDCFVNYLREKDIEVNTGVFQAYMQVELENDGPATFVIDKTMEVNK